MHATYIEVFCPLVPFYFSNIVLPKLKTLKNLEEFYTFAICFILDVFWPQLPITIQLM